MDWKPLLKMFLMSVLLGFYLILKALAPDFPLTQDSFIELVLWIVAFAVGGWQAKTLNYNLKIKRYDDARNER